MQPSQLRAVPSSGSSPGRICLVPERATRRVALRMDVQAVKQLQDGGALTVQTSLGSTASSSSSEVIMLAECMSMHADIPQSACYTRMRAARNTCTAIVLCAGLACFEALLKRLRGR